MIKASEEVFKEIEDKYVFGIEKDGKLHFPSFQELADIYNLSKATVFNYSKKGQWEEKREIFKNKNLEKINIKKEQLRIDNIADNVSGEIVNFDIECLNIAKDGVKKCMELLNSFSESEVQPPYALERISAALDKFQKVGKNAIGEVLPGNDTININFVDNDSDNLDDN